LLETNQPFSDEQLRGNPKTTKYTFHAFFSLCSRNCQATCTCFSLPSKSFNKPSDNAAVLETHVSRYHGPFWALSPYNEGYERLIICFFFFLASILRIHILIRKGEKGILWLASGLPKTLEVGAMVCGSRLREYGGRQKSNSIYK
jgi:hypothetical protein